MKDGFLWFIYIYISIIIFSIIYNSNYSILLYLACFLLVFWPNNEANSYYALALFITIFYLAYNHNYILALFLSSLFLIRWPKKSIGFIIILLLPVYLFWSFPFLVIATISSGNIYFSIIGFLFIVSHVYFSLIINDIDNFKGYIQSLEEIIEKDVGIEVNYSPAGNISYLDRLLNRKEKLVFLKEEVFSNEVCYVFNTKRPVILLSSDYSSLSYPKVFLIQHELFHASIITKILDKKMNLFVVNVFVVGLIGFLFMGPIFLTMIFGAYGIEKLYHDEESIHDHRDGFLESLADFSALRKLRNIQNLDLKNLAIWNARERSKSNNDFVAGWASLLYSLSSIEDFKKSTFYSELSKYITGSAYLNKIIINCVITLISVFALSLIFIGSKMDGTYDYQKNINSLFITAPLLYWYFFKGFYKKVSLAFDCIFCIFTYEKILGIR